MDGYSVSEAASVLGVPIERVWELLARGILSGAPEGETGMRVFLQPRPAPQPEPPAPRGNGSAEPERELSPFRELLTEFRNLTERYGQALLALGESRGEVAALRSRVDLLEARMDLGLPAPAAPARPRGWWPGAGPYPGDEGLVPAQPPQAATAPEEVATAPDEAAESEQPVEPEHTEEAHGPDEHRARPRGPRRATESFAEAIARAQDPSLPELPDEPIPQPAHGPAPEPMTDAPVATEADEAAVPDVPEPTTSAEPDEEPEPEPETEATEDEPVPDAAVEPLEWDAERYTATIDEPDWFEAEADREPEPVTEPATQAAKPALAAEPAEQAAEEPAEEPEEALPGGDDLKAALEALGVPQVPDLAPAPEPPPDPTPARPSPAASTAPAAQPIPESALRYRPVAPAGPTGRAYRRLRRIFPS